MSLQDDHWLLDISARFILIAAYLFKIPVGCNMSMLDSDWLKHIHATYSLVFANLL
jgi:hypothetical protein